MEKAAEEGFEPENYSRIRASAVESVSDYAGFFAKTAEKMIWRCSDVQSKRNCAGL